MSVMLDGTINGFAFDGISQTDFIITTGNPFTAAFWVKTTQVTTGFFFNLAGASNTYGCVINDSTTNVMEMYQGNFGVGSVAINDGAWHSCICIYDGTNFTVYTDGIAGTPVAATVATTGVGNTFTFGNQFPTFTGNIYNGKASRFAFYNNHAFTSGERATYISSAGLTIPSSPQANYIFASSIALNTDSSGNGHTLTPHGTGSGWTYSTDEPTAPSGTNSGFFFAAAV